MLFLIHISVFFRVHWSVSISVYHLLGFPEVLAANVLRVRNGNYLDTISPLLPCGTSVCTITLELQLQSLLSLITCCVTKMPPNDKSWYRKVQATFRQWTQPNPTESGKWHHMSIKRGVDIQLHTISASFQGSTKGWQRVFWTNLRSTPMRPNQCPRRGHLASAHELRTAHYVTLSMGEQVIANVFACIGVFMEMG